ncbi:MAG: cobalamin B12-binding domain-containing protein [Actinobacteria bacterium]|nr:cobalamin B12-binding domain-containing protein [Actinomycetota bacterium]
MERKIRVLLGKPGLDGHDRGILIVGHALRDAGMEVVYSGLKQTPEDLVEAALQEDVDVLVLSILSGAHLALIPRVMELLREREATDILVLLGGVIPPDDAGVMVREHGVAKVFGPGTDTRDIVAYISERKGSR